MNAAIPLRHFIIGTPTGLLTAMAAKQGSALSPD